MPTYEYECKSCDHGFEAFQAMSDDPIKDCPECGKEVRRLIFGGSGVIFKGSGFYVTDKSKVKSASSANTPKTESACANCPANTGSSEGSSGCPAASKSEVKTA